MTTLDKLGENKIKRLLVNKIKNYFKDYEYCDVTYIEVGDKLLATSCDGYVGSTWLLPFMTWKDVGWKVCATSVSDLLVKFAKPIQIMISINIERSRKFEELENIIEGACTFCKEHGIELGKLDLNESSEFSITACVIGTCDRKVGNVITREGVVYTVPEFGYTGIVFKLLEKSLLKDYEEEQVVRRGVQILKNPKPPFYLLNLDDCIRNSVLASSDSSDGLGAVLWNFAELSNCEIIIEDLPTNNEIVEFCKDVKLDLLEVVFNGAEEYLPVLILPHDIGIVKVGPVELVPIGKIRKSSTPCVKYRDMYIHYRGWEYFR